MRIGVPGVLRASLAQQLPAVVARAAAVLELEPAVEVGQVAKPAGVTDVTDGLVGLDEHARGVVQAQVLDEGDKGFPRHPLEEPAEGRRAQVDHLRQRRLIDRAGVMLGSRQLLA